YANVSGQWVLRAHIGLPDGLHYFNDTTPIVTNTWYHVAMTYDGSYLRLYVNGQATSYAAATGPITNSNETPIIVASVNYSLINWYFPGLIDEVSVYNRSVSLSEIQSTYNAAGAGKRNAQQCVMPSTNAVGWWAGDGTTNDLAHINFGTLVSGATYAS